MEEVFGVSSSYAAMAAGAVVVLAGATGQTLGGIWVGKASPTVRRQLIFAISMLCLSFLTNVLNRSLLNSIITNLMTNTA